MLKPHVLSALGYKLEEDGVVTPTVEAEVSASVEVTPEQSEAIEEAVTQIEEVATAGAELEEAVTQQEEVEEAEATLRAIADNLRTYGQLPQQMYDFLQKTGYLDVIAAAQSSAMNRVQYPAVESINPTALNRQVVDGIISGCEAMLEGAGKRVMDFLKNIWDKIVELWDRLIVFVMGNKSQIEKMGQKFSDKRQVGDESALSSAPYNPRMMGSEKAISIGKDLAKNADILKAAADEFAQLGRWERIKAGFNKDFASDKIEAAVKAMETFTPDSLACGKSKFIEAITDGSKELANGGKMYNAAIKAIDSMKQAKSIASVAKTIGKNLEAAASKAQSETMTSKQPGGIEASLKDSSSLGEAQKVLSNASKKYASACANFQKVCMFTIRSYMYACGVATSNTKVAK